MRNSMRLKASAGVLALALSLVGAAHAQTAPAPYPVAAPLEQYRVMAEPGEAAIARSAAPPAISNDADVMVMGAHGYETVAKGKNGFVCIVERSWASDVNDAEFWNPKERAPICFNAAAARTVLPTYLQRTEWVLAGATREDIITRTNARQATNPIPDPEIGSMCYMMSKFGYLSDKAGGHWRPHLMFFMPKRIDPSEWGANLPGGAVMGDKGGLEPVTVFFAAVPNWSDGTPGPAPAMKM